MKNDILTVEQLNAYYKNKQVLHDISFHIGEGEIVGLVGESGCGKSTLGKSILGMVKQTDGTITNNGGRIQMVFQDPFHSLNPKKKIGWILSEPLYVNHICNKQEREQRVREMLHRVGLDEEISKRYPNELSGGQRQRVCIALSLMLNPKLIIADEPVSALDVTIQAKILKLLLELNHKYGIAILFISHDLKVVYEMCSRIMIMRDGRIIEQGTDDEIFFHPTENYTKTLLASIM